MDNTSFTITKDYQGHPILLIILHMLITTCVKWKFTVCLKSLFHESNFIIQFLLKSNVYAFFVSDQSSCIQMLSRLHIMYVYKMWSATFFHIRYISLKFDLILFQDALLLAFMGQTVPPRVQIPTVVTVT